MHIPGLHIRSGILTPAATSTVSQVSPPPPGDNDPAVLIAPGGRRGRERSIPPGVRDLRGAPERTVLPVARRTSQRPMWLQHGARTVRQHRGGLAPARPPVSARRPGRSGAVAHPLLQPHLPV